MKNIQSMEINTTNLHLQKKIVHEFVKSIYNPVEESYILYYRIYMVKYYSRRLLGYEVVYDTNSISISKKLKSINGKDKEAALNHIVDNWSDYIQLFYNNLYASDIVKNTEKEPNVVYSYGTEGELRSFLKNKWEIGDSVLLYNGYNGEYMGLISNEN